MARPESHRHRKLGPIRTPGGRDGLTRKMAEARLRKLMSEVTVAPVYERMTVEEAGERLIQHLVTRGRKASTTVGYQSYLRVHVAPFFGDKPVANITKEDIEEFIVVCFDNDQSIKSTRNYLGFLHSVFDFALRKGWVVENPCKTVEKPETVDEDQDIRFLDQTELDALLAATAGPRTRRKAGTPERTRRVRRLRDDERMAWKAIAAELGVAESTAIYLYGLDLDDMGPADPLSVVERVLYLTAAMTGMRQGELLALRGWTSTGSRTASGYVATSSAASSGRRSPSAHRGASRSPTTSPVSSSCCSRPRAIRPTRTSCSPTRTAAGRSTARCFSSASRRRSGAPASARSAFTT